MEKWRVGYTVQEYDFFEEQSLNSIGCRDPVISRKIAEKLADMHNMPVDQSHFEEFGDMLNAWMTVCENHCKYWMI